MVPLTSSALPVASRPRQQARPHRRARERDRDPRRDQHVEHHRAPSRPRARAARAAAADVRVRTRSHMWAAGAPSASSVRSTATAAVPGSRLERRRPASSGSGRSSITRSRTLELQALPRGERRVGLEHLEALREGRQLGDAPDERAAALAADDLARCSRGAGARRAACRARRRASPRGRARGEDGRRGDAGRGRASRGAPAPRRPRAGAAAPAQSPLLPDRRRLAAAGFLVATAATGVLLRSLVTAAVGRWTSSSCRASPRRTSRRPASPSRASWCRSRCCRSRTP